MNRIDYLTAVAESQKSSMEIFMALQNDAESGVIVDVRIADKAFMKEKIMGAKEISLIDLAGKLSDLPKDKTIYVTTWSGACTLAKQASILLLNNGYTVLEIGGGNAEWKNSGLPMEDVK